MTYFHKVNLNMTLFEITPTPYFFIRHNRKLQQCVSATFEWGGGTVAVLKIGSCSDMCKQNLGKYIAMLKKCFL